MVFVKIKNNKILFILLLILGLVFALIGATYAYFSASITGDGNAINGSSYVFNVSFDVDTIRNGNLIPVVDDLVDDTLNSTHICEDTRGYGLCSLYKITFTNSGGAEDLTGSLKTISSTYTTSNLKYQLFTLNNSAYSAISSATAIDRTANAINYFKLNNADVVVSLADGSASSTTKDIYLAIWISDPDSNQLDDQNKEFTGELSFTSTSGNTITSAFINS